MRQQYADGVPVGTICAEHKIRHRTLYRWVDGGPPGKDQLPPIPRRSLDTPRTSRSRKALIARLWRTASRQVREIEERLGRAEGEPGERERDARTFAILVKTLRELSLLDDVRFAAKKDSGAPTQVHEADDDPVPRDIGEFRRELARRIRAFVASKSDSGLPGDAEK